MSDQPTIVTNIPKPATPGQRINYIVGQLVAIAARVDDDDMELGGVALALGMIGIDIDAEIDQLRASHQTDARTTSSRAIREAARYIQDFRSEYTAAEALEEYAAEQYPTTAKPLDRFKVVYEAPAANSAPVVADEVRCLDCQSITGMARVFEPTLAQVVEMAGRHECSPRFPADADAPRRPVCPVCQNAPAGCICFGKTPAAGGEQR